ncbi:hypothetical protein [Rubidibacter lacunae]|uniref:hypothetical protein n=1 Tax=Rubidibacter lacunae TaxID=582514 RepID=UPI0012EBB2D2|nr:hypothetical protein [Rubidibacter lacunae]
MPVSMVPPIVDVEVVSPAEMRHDRDYLAERERSRDLGIPEFWIVDLQVVVGLGLDAGAYNKASELRKLDRLVSPAVLALELPVERFPED